jgi:tRNA threonylcarbamoyl adenosine modification protein (Sua5/YciO/YrdC/YwlC family)
VVQIISASSDDPQEDSLCRAVDGMRAGGVVGVPTDTFYGLAVDCFNADALRRMNRLKGKDEDSPILLLAAYVDQVSNVAGELPLPFMALAGRFWPGPLTLVIPASSDLPREVSGGRGTVAVRVPGLKLPRDLAAALGRPISGASANRTGEAPCRTAADVAREFPEGLRLIVDGGPTVGGAPSTILDLCGDSPRILREGSLSGAELSSFLGGAGSCL